MNLVQLLKQLESSEVFKNFKEKNPDSFLCAGFFIIDLKQGIFDYSLDYRNEQQIFTFKIPVSGEIILLTEDILDLSKKLSELDSKIKIEIENLSGIAEKELVRNDVKNKLEKIIAVLQQNEEGKTIWNLTCMCAGFAILTISIDAKSGNILKFEKRNLFDFIKK